MMKRFFAFLVLPVLLLGGCRAETAEATGTPTTLDPDAGPCGVGTLLETDYPGWVLNPQGIAPGEIRFSINQGDGKALDSGNFLLTNANGETLCQADVALSGTMESFRSGSGLTSVGVEYTVPDCDSFVFVPEDPSLALYLMWNYGVGGVRVSGTNIHRVELQKKQVTLFGENMSYNLGFSGDEHCMSMTGEGEQEAKMTSLEGQEQVLFQSNAAPFTINCEHFGSLPQGVTTGTFSPGVSVLAHPAAACYTVEAYTGTICSTGPAVGTASEAFGAGTLLALDRCDSSLDPGHVLMQIRVGDGTGQGNFTLTNAQDQLLHHGSQGNTGTMEVRYQDGTRYHVQDSNGFVFEPEDSSMPINLIWGYDYDYGVTVSGTNIQRMELQKNKVVLLGEDMSYEMHQKGRHNYMSIAGEGETKAEMRMAEGEGQILFSGYEAPFTVTCNHGKNTVFASRDVVARFSPGETALAAPASSCYILEPQNRGNWILPLAAGILLVLLAVGLVVFLKKKRNPSHPDAPAGVNSREELPEP